MWLSFCYPSCIIQKSTTINESSCQITQEVMPGTVALTAPPKAMIVVGDMVSISRRNISYTQKLFPRWTGDYNSRSCCDANNQAMKYLSHRNADKMFPRQSFEAHHKKPADLSESWRLMPGNIADNDAKSIKGTPVFPAPNLPGLMPHNTTLDTPSP